ncbi:hypothetical protein TIFTF001_013964 [Ficus carica]|uniref:Uncharacterized protein n=1 Tax=Ficus carica TaxID=3494 RepID=A0AA88A590_FICCA|nr:hypothetical protein TIFTF001_013964 [Ficus carica]
MRDSRFTVVGAGSRIWAVKAFGTSRSSRCRGVFKDSGSGELGNLGLRVLEGKESEWTRDWG